MWRSGASHLRKRACPSDVIKPHEKNRFVPEKTAYAGENIETDRTRPVMTESRQITRIGKSPTGHTVPVRMYHGRGGIPTNTLGEGEVRAYWLRWVSLETKRAHTRAPAQGH